MSGLVYDALQAQAKVSQGKSEYVFCTRSGEPLDHNNITKRVWYPLLRFLDIKARRPYSNSDHRPLLPLENLMHHLGNIAVC